MKHKSSRWDTTKRVKFHRCLRFLRLVPGSTPRFAHAARSDLFKACWTNEIHDEWIRNVLESRPDLALQTLTRTKEKMNTHVRDCLVTGYENLIDGLVLPDPDDRHVLAAAVRCHAAVIVTFNLKDFPVEALRPYGVEAQHPDDFVMDLLDLSPAAVCRAAESCRRRLKNRVVSF